MSDRNPLGNTARSVRVSTGNGCFCAVAPVGASTPESIVARTNDTGSGADARNFLARVLPVRGGRLAVGSRARITFLAQRTRTIPTDTGPRHRVARPRRGTDRSVRRAGRIGAGSQGSLVAAQRLCGQRRRATGAGGGSVGSATRFRFCRTVEARQDLPIERFLLMVLFDRILLQGTGRARSAADPVLAIADPLTKVREDLRVAGRVATGPSARPA
jgi:hypothetical protein